ncbi:MAG: hypothetical protein FK733_13915 [Asgard group archaeon]|nr:hypothetical protein [Asgard group archaeon]
MLENDDEDKFVRTSTRTGIHSEIEEVLLNKLFKVVETIELDSEGNLNFKPYTDHELLQLEAFIEKKFKQKIFKKNIDQNIASFLGKIKNERERRDFGVLFNR